MRVSGSLIAVVALTAAFVQASNVDFTTKNFCAFPESAPNSHQSLTFAHCTGKQKSLLSKTIGQAHELLDLVLRAKRTHRRIEDLYFQEHFSPSTKDFVTEVLSMARFQLARLTYDCNPWNCRDDYELIAIPEITNTTLFACPPFFKAKWIDPRNLRDYPQYEEMLSGRSAVHEVMHLVPAWIDIAQIKDERYANYTCPSVSWKKKKYDPWKNADEWACYVHDVYLEEMTRQKVKKLKGRSEL